MAGSTGVYRTTPRTLVDGEEGNLTLDSAGKLITTATASGNVASGATDSGNPVKVAGRVITDASSAGYTTGQRGDMILDGLGGLKTVIGEAGTSVDGLGTTWARYSGGYAPLQVHAANFTGSGYVLPRGDTTGTHVVPKPGTTGGLTPQSIRTGTTGVIKASAGQAFNLVLQNTNAAVRYLHLYNKATAPTLSTDTPVISIQLPASSVMLNPSLGDTHGVAFATGIAWAYTTDNNTIPTTAATSGELIATVLYK